MQGALSARKRFEFGDGTGLAVVAAASCSRTAHLPLVFRNSFHRNLIAYAFEHPAVPSRTVWSRIFIHIGWHRGWPCPALRTCSSSMTPATRSLSPGARGESPDAAPCHRLHHIGSARCRHCEARGAASPRRWSTVRGPPKVHQGRSLRSGLAQSLEDQHSSVDLVITVDHASRAPVCGVGLGRLAGVLGESVRPQPFARLAGSIQRTSLLFIIIMPGPRTTVRSSGVARSKRIEVIEGRIG